jgi:hypothetical protein
MCLGHIHLFSQSFWRKRWIRSRQNKERKDKVGNTFFFSPPAVVRTILPLLNLFGETDGSGGGKIRKEKTK